MRSVLPTALACAALAAGCGPALGDGGTIAAGDTVEVHVSVPRSGPLAAAGRDVADGAALALQERGGSAGEVEVAMRLMDAARGERSQDLAGVGENARAAAGDSAAVAYIGELTSAATAVSLPITNGASLAHVSPSATADELVRRAPGSAAPPAAQHAGARTFARVAPSDADLDRIAAEHARSGRERSEPRPVGDLGFALDREPGPGTTHVVGTALEPSLLPGERARFASLFEKRTGRSPGPLAAYGFEAMALALDAIEAAAAERGGRLEVAEALFGALREGGPLGRYRVGAVGDTDLGLAGVARLAADGSPEDVGALGLSR